MLISPVATSVLRADSEFKSDSLAMKQLILVGIGGALGSMCRFKLGAVLAAQFPSAPLPATLWINLLGCFLIGVLAALGEKREIVTPEIRALLMTGVLGGFTTFSAFGLETFGFWRGEKMGLALVYGAMSVIGGILMVALGWQLVEMWPWNRGL